MHNRNDIDFLYWNEPIVYACARQILENGGSYEQFLIECVIALCADRGQLLSRLEEELLHKPLVIKVDQEHFDRFSEDIKKAQANGA